MLLYIIMASQVSEKKRDWLIDWERERERWFGFGYCFTPTDNEAWAAGHIIDTSEPVDGNGAQNTYVVVTVQSGVD
jgi:hypothetical protein